MEVDLPPPLFTKGVSVTTLNASNLTDNNQDVNWNEIIERCDKVASVPCVNISLIGNASVGKTSLLHYYSRREQLSLAKVTIGIELQTVWLKVLGHPVKVKLWDTAGQEEYQTLTPNYIKGLDGVLLVFDLTDAESFDNTLNWYKQIKNYKDIPVVFLGNKSDLEDTRKVEHGAMQ